MRIILASVLLFALLSAAPARAALVMSGQTQFYSQAFQDITLLPGTPFNPGTDDFFIPNVVGSGFLTLNRDAQTGTTINIPSLTGVYTGSNAAFGSFRFGTLRDAEFSGSITNVVQDENDPGFASGDPSSFQSGDYQVSGDFFEFELLGSGAFFTTGAVTFNSVFDGLPPSAGTIIDGGNDAVDIFLGDTRVGYSTNRRIIVTAVPEPSALALAGLASVFGLGGRRRSRAGRSEQS